MPLLKQFTGTKTVKACPMSRKSAEEIIGRKMRPDSDEIEDEHGYLVQYPDGYTSWSPTKAFEEAYRLSETHIDRMLIEKEELEKRFLAGRKFTFSGEFAGLTEPQRKLLRRQLNLMEDYLYTLCERIGVDVAIETEKKFINKRCDNGTRLTDTEDCTGQSAELSQCND